MDITFLEEKAKKRTFTLPCPSCKSKHLVSNKERCRTTEICVDCGRIFFVQMYPGGMIVVE
jgi:transposase-like protein